MAILTALYLLILMSSLILIGMHLCAHYLLERDEFPVLSNRPVSILRPLKGAVCGLEENLESLCGQDHPDFEIIVAAADPADPALEVARRVRDKYPNVAFRVFHGEWSSGLNPKVRMLRHMLGYARHRTILISDDNVRAPRSYLRATAGALATPGTGLVSNLVVGIGGNSLGSVCENLQLNGFILSSVAASYLLGHPVVVGKSMMICRDALNSVGGLAAVADVLAEDHLLGRAIARAGYRVTTIGQPVYTVNAGWSLQRMLSRHIRWGKLRASIAPMAFPFELLAHPLLIWLLLALYSGLAGTQPPSSWFYLAGAGAMASLVSELVILRRVQGSAFRLRDVLLIPLRSLLALSAQCISICSPVVRWRDVSYRVGPQSRLIPVRPAGRFLQRLSFKRAT